MQRKVDAVTPTPSNIPFEEKGKRADEFIQVLKKIWADDVVEFKGQYYNVPASKVEPKPVQKQHIPVYFGAFIPNTFARIARRYVTLLPRVSYACALSVHVES